MRNFIFLYNIFKFRQNLFSKTENAISYMTFKIFAGYWEWESDKVGHDFEWLP